MDSIPQTIEVASPCSTRCHQIIQKNLSKVGPMISIIQNGPMIQILIYTKMIVLSLVVRGAAEPYSNLSFGGFRDFR